MSIIVKDSDLQHIIGTGLKPYLEIQEEDLNLLFERLAEPNGFTVVRSMEEDTNYRLVAERSGNSPATRIFLREYSLKEIRAYCFEKEKIESITIDAHTTKIECVARSTEVGQEAIDNLRSLSTYYAKLPFRSGEPSEIQLEASELYGVEKINEFFKDHRDLLPKPLRGNLPQQKNYKWLYIGIVVLLAAVLSYVAFRYLAQKRSENNS